MEFTFLTMNFFTSFVFTTVKVFVFFAVIATAVTYITKKFIEPHVTWVLPVTFSSQMVGSLFIALIFGFLSAFTPSNAKIKIADETAIKVRQEIEEVEKKIRNIAPELPSFKERAKEVIEKFEKDNFNVGE